MRKFIFYSLLFIFISSCQKEEMITGHKILESEKRNTINTVIPKFQIQEVKQWYENSRNNTSDKISNCFEPKWNFATFPKYCEGHVAIVPIEMENYDDSLAYNDISLVLYKDSITGNFYKNVLYFLGDITHYKNIGKYPSVSNFTGMSILYKEDGSFSNILEFSNGSVINYLDTVITETELSSFVMDDRPNSGNRDHETGCYNNWKKKGSGFFGKLWGTLKALLHTDGKGGDYVINNTGINFIRDFLGSYDPNFIIGSSSNVSNGSNSLFRPYGSLSVLFSEEDIYKIIRATQIIKWLYDVDLDPVTAFELFGQECLFGVTNAEPLYDPLTSSATELACINEKIQCISLAENFISEYGLQLTVNELENLVGDFYGNCGAQEDFNEFVFSSLGGIKVNVTEDNDVVTDVDAFILTYSCQSFYLTSTGANKYKTTISNLFLLFNETKLFPPGLKTYTFSISFDIEVTALPGEQPCEIKNQLAASLNKAVNDVVSIFGWDRVYKKYNATDIIERDLEIALEKELIKHFPVYARADVPASNFLGGNPPVPAIPGEVDNCCN